VCLTSGVETLRDRPQRRDYAVTDFAGGAGSERGWRCREVSGIGAQVILGSAVKSEGAVEFVLE